MISRSEFLSKKQLVPKASELPFDSVPHADTVVLVRTGEPGSFPSTAVNNQEKRQHVGVAEQSSPRPASGGSAGRKPPGDENLSGAVESDDPDEGNNFSREYLLFPNGTEDNRGVRIISYSIKDRKRARDIANMESWTSGVGILNNTSVQSTVAEYIATHNFPNDLLVGNKAHRQRTPGKLPSKYRYHNDGSVSYVVTWGKRRVHDPDTGDVIVSVSTVSIDTPIRFEGVRPYIIVSHQKGSKPMGALIPQDSWNIDNGRVIRETIKQAFENPAQEKAPQYSLVERYSPLTEEITKPPKTVKLTNMEKITLQLLALGKATPEIAAALGVEVTTTRTHTDAIRTKINFDGDAVNKLSVAILLGVKFGWIKTSSIKITDYEFTKLTPTELKIVNLLIDGYSSNLIINELKRSDKTFRTHRNNAMRKLGLKGYARTFMLVAIGAKIRKEAGLL